MLHTSHVEAEEHFLQLEMHGSHVLVVGLSTFPTTVTAAVDPGARNGLSAAVLGVPCGGAVPLVYPNASSSFVRALPSLHAVQV